MHRCGHQAPDHSAVHFESVTISCPSLFSSPYASLVRPTHLASAGVIGPRDEMQYLEAWCHAPDELKADRDIALAVVQQNSLALKCEMAGLKADMEVVLVAVGQNGMALQHVSPELIANEEVVLAAVRQNGLALQWAAPELRAKLAHCQRPVWGMTWNLWHSSLQSTARAGIGRAHTNMGQAQKGTQPVWDVPCTRFLLSKKKSRIRRC